MWESLTDLEKENILASDRDSAPSYSSHIVINEFKGILLLNVICFDPSYGLLSRGQKAIYTVNLKTSKPTKNSQIQTHNVSFKKYCLVILLKKSIS